MACGAEVLGGAKVPEFRDFVAEARGIRFPVRRCRAGRRLAPDARAAELCTDEQPCAFHSILAMALSRSFIAGRSRPDRESVPKEKTQGLPCVTTVPSPRAAPEAFGQEPARDLGFEEVAGLALAGDGRG
jgi:hypothetical protein